jgi:hypothetical protein
MSNTYTPIRKDIPYTPVTSWPAWVTLPNDGDPFTAGSANIYEKNLVDRNQLILEALWKLPTSNSVMRAKSIGPKSIRIFNYNLQSYSGGAVYFSINPGTYDINESFLVPSGTFATFTWYYVYLSTSVMGFEISDVAPEPYLLYKSDGAGGQDLSKKYICCFRTDGAGEIYPFKKVGDYHQWDDPGYVLFGGTATILTTINLQNDMPPHSKYVNTICILNPGTGTGVVSLYGSHNTAVETILRSKPIVIGATTYQQANVMNYTWSVNNDIPGTNTIAYLINTGAGYTFSVQLCGFYE